MEDVTALSDDDMPVPGGQKGGPGTTPQVPAKLVETPTAKPSPKPKAKQVTKETTPKAKAKGKSKAKATPKSKGSKTAGSNETEGVGRETPLEVNDGGKPSKSMKRPACSAEAPLPMMVPPQSRRRGPLPTKCLKSRSTNTFTTGMGLWASNVMAKKLFELGTQRVLFKFFGNYKRAGSEINSCKAFKLRSNPGKV